MVIATGFWLSRGPDETFTFSRVVPSQQSPEALSLLLAEPKSWPRWHFNAIRSEASGVIVPQSENEPAQQVRLFMEPPKKEWKRFELDLEVLVYRPGRQLTVRLKRDSKGRLEKLFSDITWSIELLPQTQEPGTLIQGTVRATSKSSRARLLTRIAPRVVLNQLFYPNLEALGDPMKQKGTENASTSGSLLPF
ncbi:MAG: hypothetical protein RJB38_1296 [Pseudomonadota bacterium]